MDLLKTLAPDLLTRSQWADRYAKRFNYLKAPYLQLAYEGVLWQCLADMKISNPVKRLLQIHDIRGWISPAGDREAVYKFSTVIEALETVLPGLTVEAARKRFHELLDRAERDAKIKLGEMLT